MALMHRTTVYLFGNRSDVHEGGVPWFHPTGSLSIADHNARIVHSYQEDEWHSVEVTRR